MRPLSLGGHKRKKSPESKAKDAVMEKRPSMKSSINFRPVVKSKTRDGKKMTKKNGNVNSQREQFLGSKTDIVIALQA